MGNSHKRRMEKVRRLQAFNEAMGMIDSIRFEQRTKYHFTATHVNADMRGCGPIEAYPTALKLVPYEGQTIQCRSIDDMLETMKYIFATGGADA